MRGNEILHSAEFILNAVKDSVQNDSGRKNNGGMR